MGMLASLLVEVKAVLWSPMIWNPQVLWNPVEICCFIDYALYKFFINENSFSLGIEFVGTYPKFSLALIINIPGVDVGFN